MISRFIHGFSLLMVLSCSGSSPKSSSREQLVPMEDQANDQVSVAPTFDFSVPDGWVDLMVHDSTFVLDIRYASTNNFVSSIMYPCARCLLRSDAASRLLQLQAKLRQEGLGLKLFDCYRPQSVQQQLWDKVPDATYVTPPAKGSMHNRGTAIDATLIDLQSGKELPMGTDYDYFGAEAHHTYRNHTPEVNRNRKLLREKMASVGFKHIRTEWWHYSYTERTHELADFVWRCP